MTDQELQIWNAAYGAAFARRVDGEALVHSKQRGWTVSDDIRLEWARAAKALADEAVACFRLYQSDLESKTANFARS